MTEFFDVNKEEIFDLGEPFPSARFAFGLNGANTGVTLHQQTEFNTPAEHDDQEGFYVIEGTGKVCLDGEVFDLKPGMTFQLAPHVVHSFARDPESKPMKVLWWHAAAV